MTHCKQGISLKKDSQRILNGWMSDNLQTTMNSFSEALYFLHVEFVANLDHYNRGARQNIPGQNIPCHFLTPRTKHPTRFATPDKTSHAVFVALDITSHAVFVIPDIKSHAIFATPDKTSLTQTAPSG